MKPESCYGQNHLADTLQNGATFADGVVGQAFSPDGVDDHVRIPNAPNLQITAASSSTLGAWIYPTALPPNQEIPVTAAKDGYFGLMYFTANRALRAHVNTGTDWIWFDAPYDLPLNRWTHVVQTWDGATLKVFVNGWLIGSGAKTSPDGPSEGLLYVGHFSGNPGDTTFSGLIDEVKVYDRALSGEEIKDQYEAVSGLQ